MTTEYQFTYSKTKGGLLVFLACFMAMILSIIICLYVKANEGLTYVIAFGAIIITFRSLRKYTFGNCTAKIGDNQIEFAFDDHVRVINCNELVSFRVYYTRSTVLTLKTTTDTFKIFANGLINQKNFISFCKDLVDYLDSYKEKFQPEMTHVGSPFAKKGMLYFIIIATVVYFLAFIIETRKLRMPIGIGGGWFLVVMWIAYFNKRKLTDR